MKKAKGDAYWQNQLTLVANGELTFSTGQAPRSNTHAWREYQKLRKCPRHDNPNTIDLFGKPIKCICGYHGKAVEKNAPKKEPTKSSKVQSSQPLPTSVANVMKTSTSTSLVTLTTTRQTIDYSARLPKEWLPKLQSWESTWIGKEIFSAKKGALPDNLKLEYYPPKTVQSTTIPNLIRYFGSKVFMWMPKTIFRMDIKCPECSSNMQRHGIHRRLRKVLDVSSYFYMAGEVYDCRCGFSSVSWGERILRNLPIAVRSRFRITLTQQYACTEAVSVLLRSRTLGNSPTSLRDSICETHSTNYLKAVISYLGDCDRHKQGLLKQGIQLPEYAKPPRFPLMPSAQWFLSMHLKDVWDRLPLMKSAIRCVTGKFLKIDSTKKICRKLQGKDAGTASWMTSVSNESGQILNSILTSSESIESLQELGKGIVNRYKSLNVDPPLVLYTDRDCCSLDGDSKLKKLFAEWPDMEVRLDSWHFMRRMATAVSTEAHPLYGAFMSRLTACIFEWDSEDMQRLRDAKAAQFTNIGVQMDEITITESISKEERNKHCRRRTRGSQTTIDAIVKLITVMLPSTDAGGNALFKPDVMDIWKEQKRHVTCLQDLPGVPLYAVTHYIQKNGCQLPVYRCARGTTSLESYHLHLDKFVPGTSANAVHFQAYVVEGIHRWNSLRHTAKTGDADNIVSFQSDLKYVVNDLNKGMFGEVMFKDVQLPSETVDENIGVDYLYAQSNLSFEPEAVIKSIDEGFSEVPEVEDIMKT